MRGRRVGFTTTILVAVLCLVPSPALGGGSLGHGTDLPPASTAVGSALVPTATANSSSPTLCADGIDCGRAPSQVWLNVSVRQPTGSAPTTPLTKIEVAFLVEANPLDGGLPCSSYPSGPDFPCSLVPDALQTFQQGIYTIIGGLDARYPQDTLSYAVADFGPTNNSVDPAGGTVFHTDISTFEGSQPFESGTQTGFDPGGTKNSWNFNRSIVGEALNSDLAESSSITALYGALAGGVFHWMPGEGHVVVLIGSGIPEDPEYANATNVAAVPLPVNATLPTCDANYTFPNGSLPACEGWVRSHNGDPHDSIAWLAHHAPVCSDGGLAGCLIDVVDTNIPPFDPTLSTFWAAFGHPASATNDSLLEATVIGAGCDLATATGGSWDGPVSAPCGSRAGTIDDPVGTPNYVGPVYSGPEPTLERALQNISIAGSEYAVTGTGPGPALTVALAPGFRLADYGAGTVTRAVCFAGVAEPVDPYDCPSAASPSWLNGSLVYGWNLSSSPSQNVLYPGAEWNLSLPLMTTSGSGTGFAQVFDLVPGWSDPDGPTGLHYLMNGTAEFAPVPQVVEELVPRPALHITINATAVAGLAPLPDTFRAIASGGWAPYTIFWSSSSGGWGLGSTYTETLPNGNDTVSATVKDSHGANATTSVTVVVGPEMTIVVDGWPSVGVAPYNTTLTASVLGDVYGPFNYTWSSGNIEFGYQSAVGAQMTLLGTQLFVVEVTDAQGSIGVGSILLRGIYAEPLNVSLALISATGGGLCGRPGVLSVNVDAVVLGGRGPFAYLWTFGDGTVAETSTGDVVHSYSLDQVYTILLTVRDVRGALGTAQLNVTRTSGQFAGCPLAGPPYSVALVAGLLLACSLGAAGLVLLVARRPRRAERHRPGR